MLSDELVKAGYAVLRFDKRGSGESKVSESYSSTFSFENIIDDAKGWAAMLDKDDRISSYGFMGHDQGSLVGIIAT